MKEIDVRGLSCPEPVLIVMDEMDAAPKEPLAVLSEEASTRDNFLKMGHEHHRGCSVEMRGKDYMITIS